MLIKRTSSGWARTLLLGLGLLLAGAAWADAPGRVGRLGETQGTVWLYDTDAGEWVAAQRNRPLTSGDRIATDQGALAEVQIGSSTVRLDGATDLDLQRIDDERMVLQLNAGSIATRLRQPEAAREFEVVTDEGRFLPQGPGHYRIDRDPDEGSTAAVWGGSLRFDAADSTLVLTNGQRAEFWRDDGVTHYSWAEMPRDRFTDWVLAEDQRDDRIAATRYVSPEMTGYGDLDAYGRWDTHPQYGAVWIPTTVVVGWAPYRYGRWIWRSPWGWTWVDDTPWGFAPFHYGRWAWWGGRWCWAPGSYVARPVYAPALVGWVGAPSVGVNIHIGRGPVVGWVPLGPREAYRPTWRVSDDHWRRINPHVPERRPPHRQDAPVKYANQGVPNAFTVVPADTLRQRRPVPVTQVAARIDQREARELLTRGGGTKAVMPPAPPPGLAARPQRPSEPPPGWARDRRESGQAADRGDRPGNREVRIERGERGDDGRSRIPRNPAAQGNTGVVPPTVGSPVPQPNAMPQAPAARSEPPRGQRDVARDDRRGGRDERDARDERRGNDNDGRPARPQPPFVTRTPGQAPQVQAPPSPGVVPVQREQVQRAQPQVTRPQPPAQAQRGHERGQDRDDAGPRGRAVAPQVRQPEPQQRAEPQVRQAPPPQAQAPQRAQPQTQPRAVAPQDWRGNRANERAAERAAANEGRSQRPDNPGRGKERD